MWLRNWEHNATSGLPISGATVEARAASLVSPNTGTVIASTTTDANGMWEFTSLPDSATDIKVIYSGNIWWHKGMTKHSVDTIFYVTPTPRTDQFLRNGGFEKGTNGPWTVTNVQQTVLESWLALNGVGSSATITRDTTIHTTDSDASAKIVQTKVSGSLNLFQQMPIPSVFRGKTVSVSFQVRQGVANSVQVYIFDGVTTTPSVNSATTGSFVTLTATATIGASATVVQIGILVNASDTVYIDDGIANLGSSASTYQPEYWFPGAASDDMIGLRQPDQTITAQSGSYGLGALVSMFANRIKAIMGTTNWYDAPATTLAAIVTSLAGKVSKTGDTITGFLSFNANGQGIIFSGGGQIRDDSTTQTAIYANGDKLIVANESGSTTYLDITGSFLKYLGNPVWTTGNMGPSSGMNADLTDGLHAADMLARSNHTGTQLASTISNLATTVQTLDAATLGGGVTVSQIRDRSTHTGTQLAGTISDLPSFYARRASGTYTGSGSANAKSVGFQAEFVTILDHTTGSLFLVTRTGAISQSGGVTAAPPGLHIDTGTTFTVGTIASDANQSGRSYSWVAYS
jgi:hypothetical protein